MGRSRGLHAGLAALAVVALCSENVVAHGVDGSRFDAPVPLPLLFGGAAATVALTAARLALAGEAQPPAGSRRVATIPPRVARPFRPIVRPLFAAAVGVAVLAGVLGPQVAVESVTTAFVWPVWFHGLALYALLAGSPWSLLSPWRTLYDVLCRLEGRPVALWGALPRTLGWWPALLGLVVLLGILENLTVVPRSPRLSATVVAGYGLVVLVGAVLFGDAWLRRADPLAVLYRLFGRVAPVQVDATEDGGYTLSLRPPWRGCRRPVADSSLVAVVVLAVFTVSFDGFTATVAFQSALFAVRDAFGTGPLTSVLLYGAGFVGSLGVFVATAALAERAGAGSPGAAARSFAPSVLPIAAGYEVAHNYPYVLANLGTLLKVALGPFVAVGTVDPLWWLPVSAFWASQVVLVVAGHVVAVVAAHRVAVDRYGRAATRAHAPMVVLMVGYTVLSLWIVSRPVA